MRVIVGITGGIAAYKAPQLVRLLKKQGHEVQCVATRHALEFVTPLTLETVSGNRLYSELFAPVNDHSTEHIALKDWGDIMVVAPATANCIGKLASGIADDALSTLLLAFSHKPLYLAPAMNTDMWEHPAVQQNIATLKARGVNIIDPADGELACGATGAGRMAEPEDIASAIRNEKLGIRNLADESNNSSFLIPHSSLSKVLVTAGPTYEKIDSVRFIGNYSSGKMGFALAEALAAEGYGVELVTGPTACRAQHPNIHRTDVESAREMYEAATRLFPSCSAAILSAAVADYRPDHTADHKLKKQGDEGMTLTLVQNPDILATLGTMKQEGQRLVGFALETDDEEANARRKLEKKNLDYIVLNSLRDKGAGFGVDTNRVTIIGRDGSRTETPLLSKADVAREIVRRCLR
ncbi:MAG: bifunctional phosphopantothenoylcysteine decarboxylase/phosphopantothenate--cysteine ligase CoaBC [Bacteroidales bacterium]|nr:bifunctional phosphopantothenoylcysteine decarboxylase/phosphopantothenate--cysteine ligase CoaBC [Bacteroidales bacterium]